MASVGYFDFGSTCARLLTLGLWLACFVFCQAIRAQETPPTGTEGRSNFTLSASPKTNSVKSHSLDFETIDFPGALATRALGINAQGDIVGSFDDANGTHAFLLEGSRFEVLDVPGSQSTQAKCINARGEIVGYYLDSDSNLHGFYWRYGNFQTLDVPFSTETRAEGINEAGTISGEFVDQEGNEHGYLLREGRFETIDVPSSFTTDVWMVSNNGWLAGDYSSATTVLAFVRTKERGFLALQYPGAAADAARSINDRHEVVGRWDDHSVSPVQTPCTTQCHGFYWFKGEFQSVDVPGALYTVALGINSSGYIVGRYVDASKNEHGFITRPKDDE